MGALRVMSRRGDTSICWDLPRVQAGDPEALAAVIAAERTFNAELDGGATAYRVVAGRAAERLKRFDRRAEQIVIVPRVVGGCW